MMEKLNSVSWGTDTKHVEKFLVYIREKSSLGRRTLPFGRIGSVLFTVLRMAARKEATGAWTA